MYVLCMYVMYLSIYPLLQGSLSPKGRDLMETTYLGMHVPRSLILWIMSCLYVSQFFFPFAAGEIVSDDG